jgi:hypothetical protein
MDLHAINNTCSSQEVFRKLIVWISDCNGISDRVRQPQFACPSYSFLSSPSALYTCNTGFGVQSQLRHLISTAVTVLQSLGTLPIRVPEFQGSPFYMPEFCRQLPLQYGSLSVSSQLCETTPNPHPHFRFRAPQFVLQNRLEIQALRFKSLICKPLTV